MSMKNPTHPGAGIRDDLEELGWTVTEASRRMGVRRKNLSHPWPSRHPRNLESVDPPVRWGRLPLALVIHGQVGISPKMALAL